MRPPLVLAAAMLVASGACDQPRSAIMAPQGPPPIRLLVPDADFHLSASERAQVRQGFDVDALERLLASLKPAVRPIILQPFLQPKPGEPAENMVWIADPSLQPLLDEVWAPMWDHVSRAAIDNEATDFPGRELARQRRAARESPIE